MSKTEKSRPPAASAPAQEWVPGGILDGHTHLASLNFIPLSFIRGAIENVLAASLFQGVPVTATRLLDLYLKGMHDDSGAGLVAEMDRAGIAASVLLLPDFTWALRDCTLSIAEMFERHCAVLRQWPGRFFVFAGVDPRWGEDGIDLFERGVTEFGFHGLKLYPPCGYSPSDRSLYPFYEICARHRIPVLTHTGPTSPALTFDSARPIFVDQAARDFPGVNFILAHGCGTYLEECAMLCAYRPNVFLDVSGFQTVPRTRLNALFEHNINHKIIFGTDWPLFRMSGSQESVVRNLFEKEGAVARLRPFERAAFFRGTLEQLLAGRAASPPPSKNPSAGSSCEVIP